MRATDSLHQNRVAADYSALLLIAIKKYSLLNWMAMPHDFERGPRGPGISFLIAIHFHGEAA
jgi:hypothetical protein